MASLKRNAHAIGGATTVAQMVPGRSRGHQRAHTARCRAWLGCISCMVHLLRRPHPLTHTSQSAASAPTADTPQATAAPGSLSVKTPSSTLKENASHRHPWDSLRGRGHVQRVAAMGGTSAIRRSRHQRQPRLGRVRVSKQHPRRPRSRARPGKHFTATDTRPGMAGLHNMQICCLVHPV
mgnify:CR=1 FL=1